MTSTGERRCAAPRLGSPFGEFLEDVFRLRLMTLVVNEHLNVAHLSLSMWMMADGDGNIPTLYDLGSAI